MIRNAKSDKQKKAIMERDLQFLTESSLVLIASGAVSHAQLIELCADRLAERGLDRFGHYVDGMEVA